MGGVRHAEGQLAVVERQFLGEVGGGERLLVMLGDDGGLVVDDWVWDNFVYSSRSDGFLMWEPVPGTAALFVVDVRGNYGETSGYPFACLAWLNGDSAHAVMVGDDIEAAMEDEMAGGGGAEGDEAD